MRLYFKQRFFSWLDSYDIFDGNGNTVFTVEGQLSWGHKLAIYNAGGEEVGMVKEVVLLFCQGSNCISMENWRGRCPRS